MERTRLLTLGALVAAAACSSSPGSVSRGPSVDASADGLVPPKADASFRKPPPRDAGHASKHDATRPPSDAASPHDAGSGDAPSPPGLDATPSPDAPSTPDTSLPCSTRVTYGSAWIHPSGHTASFDDVPGPVTWDGTCTEDGADSFATLSNGWKPVFTGHSACVLALDASLSCGSGSSAPCSTRITYGSGWLAPSGHAASYDDVTGRVFASGVCTSSGAESSEALSNGWVPFFQGANACGLSLEYTQCGGLYANPVIPHDCPDPGVLYDSGRYVLTCTSGDAANAYPIYTSPDLVTWTPHGYIFPSGSGPAWAASDFWAPEIHHVGSHYVAYFSARDQATGQLSIGAASAASALGPFTDLGAPLLQQASMGLIDASEINASDGTAYVLWKEDGNAIGKPTPIHSQPLAADGLSLTGSPATLITNDQAWEGAVTEAPFMVQHGATFFLFYSGNSYANASYAVGVASASSPSGPFTKASAPIVTTAGAWVGPGHCAVVDTPQGDTYMIYAAWQNGCVNGPGCGRLDLTDALVWGAGAGAWPSVPFAPSSATRPLP